MHLTDTTGTPTLNRRVRRAAVPLCQKQLLMSRQYCACAGSFTDGMQLLAEVLGENKKCRILRH